jgi:general secretion pathway protein G
MRRAQWFSRGQIGLLVLLWAAALVFVFGGRGYITTVRHARESALKEDLQTMRRAIDDYIFDKLRYPETLETLVDEGYLRVIPTNPFTQKVDWVLHYINTETDAGRSVVGIDDVHASAPYSDW